MLRASDWYHVHLTTSKVSILRGSDPLSIPLQVCCRMIVRQSSVVLLEVVGHPDPASITSAKQQSNRLCHVDTPQSLLPPFPVLPAVEKVHCSLVIQQTHHDIGRLT